MASALGLTYCGCIFPNFLSHVTNSKGDHSDLCSSVIPGTTLVSQCLHTSPLQLTSLRLQPADDIDNPIITHNAFLK